MASIRTQARVNALETLSDRRALQYAIESNLPAPHCYSGPVMEVEFEKIRQAVLQMDDGRNSFYATIAPESFLADARDYLSKPKNPFAARQWADTHMVNLGISTGRLREGGADRVLVLLCSGPTWLSPGSGSSDLLHFAVLRIDLHRAHASFGATSVAFTIYDSYRLDPFAQSTCTYLDDDAIKRRWQPQLDVIKILIGPAAKGAELSVASVPEQHPTSNDCGVHAIMIIEALATLQHPEQAVAAIDPGAVRERRERILAWWKAQLDEESKDVEFFANLQRRVV
jgi:hypothetical protein